MRVFACSFAILAAVLTSIPAAGAITTESVVSGLTEPLFVTSPPGDDRLFIVTKRGTIRIVADGSLLPTPFLDLTGDVNFQSERGLLGLAFHPDFASNGLFFVHYSSNEAGFEGDTVVSRFEVSGDPNVADENSEVVFLEVDQPFANHNGGMISFRPNDPNNYLYVALGDGGSSNDPDERAQNLNTLLGKILRIDIDAGAPAAAPPTNPFVDVAGDDLIWAYGLRNPWRFSFDRLTGDLYIGDVGQNAVEEIDFEPAGDPGGNNYGWDLLEGSSDFECTDCDNARETTVLPIHEYGHGDGVSVTGGYVYRGSAIPELEGTYFFADLVGRVWSFRYDGNVLTDFQEWGEEFISSGRSIVSFGEDADGELYIVDIGGEVLRIIDDSALEVTTVTGGGIVEVGRDVTLTATVVGTEGATTYAWERNGNPLSDGGRISGSDTSTLSISTVEIGDSGSYVLRVEDESKAVIFSNPVLLTVAAEVPAYGRGALLMTVLALTAFGILARGAISGGRPNAS